MKLAPELVKSVEFIKKKTAHESRIGVILGSGLGSFADNLEDKTIIATNQIPNYPKSTVEGHQGNLVFGYWESRPLIAVQGRTHFYEGYPGERVTFVVRLLKALQIDILIITNAAGGINPLFEPGDLMLITDQINFMFQNPLMGPLKFGEPRFPDMSKAYTPKYHNLIKEVATKLKINLKTGVLFTSTGPSYESAAEVKMAARMGADAASMSTVPEVIAANHAGLDVIGVSCITNMATGIKPHPLSHEEVTRTAELVKNEFIRLMTGIITQIY